MHGRFVIVSTVCVLASAMPGVRAQSGAPAQGQAAAAPDPIKTMVDRLDLEKYKATIKGLTQFGDRRQGTERNRDAVDWIEAQLKSYGCTTTERIKYDYQPPPRARPRRGRGGARRRGQRGGGRAARPRRHAGAGRRTSARHPHAHRRQHRSAERSPTRSCARSNTQPTHAGPARGGVLHEGRHDAPRGDVHRRRPHGRPRLGRGGERRRLGHGAGDGARARLQQPGRADRALDPLRALEQRGDRTERRARLRRAARRRCRARRTRPARASIPSRSGSA